MFSLRLLGRFSLDRTADGSPVLANQRKALALLAVLGASRTAVSRDRLMALLWSESDDARARGSLKQLLHLVRRQIGNDDAIEGLSELRLNPAIVTSDLAQFRGALSAGDDELAASLYAGPFLDGIFIEGADEFERWSTGERQELGRQFAESLERLAVAAAAKGNADEAVSRWRQLHDTDPTNGRLVIGLMTALDAAGDRAGAIRLARAHEALLQEELGAPPDGRVMNFAEELLRAPIKGSNPPSAGVATTLKAPAVMVHPNLPAHSVHLPAEGIPSARTSTPSARSTRPPGARYLGGVLAVIVLAASGWFYANRAKPTGDSHALQPGRVAVAMLINRTGDAKLDALGMMASDWLSRGLSRVPSVDVVEAGGLYLRGRTQTGEAVDPIEMARANGASIVVAGNYYYQNASRDSITFSTQVIDVKTGGVKRALEPVSAATVAPIAALDELRQRISSALGTLLDPRMPILNSPLLLPPKLDAYSEFLIGQDVYWRGDWETSLPHFRRAAVLDTMFYTAGAFVSIAAVGTGRCNVVDSVAREFDRRRDRIPELDLLTVQSSQARCESDLAEHYRLQHRRIELMPGSKFLQLWLATTLRTRNLPAEGLATLSNVDPSRDLGWLNERGRSFFWRELAANHHMLGDHRAERETANKMKRAGGTALAFAYFTARSMAESGQADSALLQLHTIKSAANDPALLSGLINGQLNAVQLATPGWVMFQTALELSRSGHEGQARAAASMAIEWFESKGSIAALPPEQQWLLAHTYMFAGRLAEAASLAGALLKAQPELVEFRGLSGVVAARSGDFRRVKEIEQWLVNAEDVFPVGAPTLYRAEIASVLGDTAKAMQLIESLPHGVHPYDWIQFHTEPAFRNLYTVPRFQRLLVPKG
ncbi:MAG: hypothetical protein H7Z40_21605 [Phycisphaerae bacterium]|nr:hypothetical protein [Gemmatimonadaceae bacterium]